MKATADIENNAEMTDSKDIEQRFCYLLQIMKQRYLNSGYELDDVHLAQILDVHYGVLRKGKTISVSPSLALAVGNVWNIDLNWLLLGIGNPPEENSPAPGIEKLSLEERVARGNWDEHKVRLMLKKHNLTQKKLARLLKTETFQVGSLVRGARRESGLRIKLANLLGVKPEDLFLKINPETIENNSINSVVTSAGQKNSHFSLTEIKQALTQILESDLESRLEKVKQSNQGEYEYESTETILEIPPAPDWYDQNERNRYERNKKILQKWSKTEKSFHVPPSVTARYCREQVAFYDGGHLDEIGGLLRDYIQKNTEMSDTLKGTTAQRIELRKGVVSIGDQVIEVDNPELLAKLPEYLNSETGKMRLLQWLRDNVGEKE